MGLEIRRLPSVAKRYAKDRSRIWESLALRLVLRMLERFTKKDASSYELLHFGCLVRAVKKESV
jgi:hypothetical protein